MKAKTEQTASSSSSSSSSTTSTNAKGWCSNITPSPVYLSRTMVRMLSQIKHQHRGIYTPKRTNDSDSKSPFSPAVPLSSQVAISEALALIFLGAVSSWERHTKAMIPYQSFILCFFRFETRQGPVIWRRSQGSLGCFRRRFMSTFSMRQGVCLGFCGFCFELGIDGV